MAKLAQSVHLTTLFPRQVNQYFVHILSLLTDNNPTGMINGREENGCRDLVMINLGPRVPRSLIGVTVLCP